MEQFKRALSPATTIVLTGRHSQVSYQFCTMKLTTNNLFIYLFKTSSSHTNNNQTYQNCSMTKTGELKIPSMIKNTNGVGDGEEGHADTKTRPLQCRLRSILFNLNLKLEKLGASTTYDGKEFQQSICLL